MIKWTGERYLPYIDPSICGAEIHYEHLHRYAFASQFVKGKKVLDLASGEGYGSFLLSKNAESVTGIEIDPDTVNHASEVYKKDNLRFLHGSIVNIPIDGEKVFDVIVCFEAIEHIEEHEILIQEIKRLIKDDGILIISTPDKQIYSDIPDYHNPFHARELYSQDFYDLLQKKFAYVYLFGQRVYSGSLIFPKNSRLPNNSCSEFVVTYEGDHFSFKNDDEKVPLYFIAIATNKKLSETKLHKSFLVDASNTEISLLSNQVSNLNQTLTVKEQQLKDISDQITNLNQIITVKEREIQEATHKNILMGQELSQIKNSIIWRTTMKYQTKVVDRFLKQGTRCRKCYDLGLKGGRILINEGFKKMYTEFKNYRRSNKFFSLSGNNKSQKSFEMNNSVFQENVDSPVLDPHNQKKAEYIPLSNGPINVMKDDIRFIAFYLPQFHPIPENDQWWGKGFTEWTNVTKAVPQYEGHYQPHFPDELGYYDLRLIEIQKRQIELAKQYGIYGFCFYYYWFNGKQLLERPLNQFLDHKELDFPFCICWANENWTRRWDGLDNEILISQQHSTESDLAFIQELGPVLNDPRYIRIGGKPLVIVYRATLLPESLNTTNRWREYCRTSGIGEIYLVAALCFGCDEPQKYGFDAAVEFPPHTMVGCINITRKMNILNPHFTGNIFDYADFVHSKSYLQEVPFKLFKTVSPGWDNTPRRLNNASIFHGATPQLYKEWLYNVATWTKQTHPHEEQIVFINAWNEWAEGTHLEPDKKFGYGYLQATAEVIRETRDPAVTSKKKIILVSHDAHFHGAQLLALNLVRELTVRFGYEVYTILKSGGVLEDEFKKYSQVLNFERDYPENDEQNTVISKLFQAGVTIAIANTVVAGDIVELLVKNHIKSVSLVHELPGIIVQMNQEENVQKIKKFADHVVFPSVYVKKKILDNTELDDPRYLVTPQGLYSKNIYKKTILEARKKLRELLSIPPDAQVVINVGYADYRKGADIFIDVAKKALKENKNVYFIWIGHTDTRFLASVQNMPDSDLKAHVLFIGKQENISLFYAGADLFLLTSREDPFPSVVLEALDVEVPVIGFSDAGGFSDILTEAGGILVPFLDTDEMARKVQYLLSNDQVRAEMGKKGSELIEKKFNFIDYIYYLLGLLDQENKKVSVIVPNYNYENYLNSRFTSILEQHYPLYEIIVLDDNSSDNSVNLIKDFARISSVPVKVIINTKNSGSVFRQWARGISESKGEYIWIAEADDLSKNTFLKEVMAGFDDTSVVLSYCQSMQINENNLVLAPDYFNYTKDINENKWKNNYTRKGIEEICDTLAIKNTIPNVSAVVFKKVDLSEIIDDLIQYKVAGDWFFYVWILHKGKISFTAQSLNMHRRHQKGVTLSENVQNHFDEIVKMQEYILQNFRVTDSVRKKVLAYREQVRRYLFRL